MGLIKVKFEINQPRPNPMNEQRERHRQQQANYRIRKAKGKKIYKHDDIYKAMHDPRLRELSTVAVQELLVRKGIFTKAKAYSKKMTDRIKKRVFKEKSKVSRHANHRFI